MANPIIYCVLGCVTALNTVKHESVRKLDSGVIAMLSEDAFKQLLLRSSNAAILYFSKDSYLDATKDLTEAQVAEVLHKRIREWAPNASVHALKWVYDEQLLCLQLTAMLQASNSGNTAVRLKQHFEQSLKVLELLSGSSRYGDDSLATLFVYLVDAEARLIEEYRDAAAAAKNLGTTSDADVLAALEQHSLSYAGALRDPLKHLGRDDYGGNLPYIPLTRGCFVHPRDAALARRIRAQCEAPVEWNDGFVATLAFNEFPELQKEGKSVQILYFNVGDFAQDLQDLTTAQLQREFSRRSANSFGASMQQRWQYVIKLLLGQHLLRRQTLTRAKSQDSNLAIVLDSQVASEERDLDTQLARHKLGAGALKLPESPTVEALQQSEARLIKDAKFFAMLCHDDGDPNGEALFTKVAQAALRQ